MGRSLDAIIPAERRGEVRVRLAEALEHGSVTFETTRRRKDGSPVVVEVSKRAVKDAQGRVLFIAVNERDVTALTRLREERAVEARFRGLLEAAPDAMVIVGEDGRIVLVNAQMESSSSGTAARSCSGSRSEMLVPERFRDASTPAIVTALLFGTDGAADGWERGEPVRPAQGRLGVPRGDQPGPDRDAGRDARDGSNPRHPSSRNASRGSTKSRPAEIAKNSRRRTAGCTRRTGSRASSSRT